MSEVSPDLLRIEEVAVELRRSARTVDRLIANGVLGTVMYDGRRYVTRSALKAMLASTGRGAS